MSNPPIDPMDHHYIARVLEHIRDQQPEYARTDDEQAAHMIELENAVRRNYQAYRRDNEKDRLRVVNALLPAVSSRMTFDTYVADTPQERTALAASVEWTCQYVSWMSLRHRIGEPPPASIVVMGGVGTGKTHLALSIAREIILSGGHVRFADVPGWLASLRASFDGCPVELGLQEACEARVLVMDDFGAERLTEWAIEQLFIVINARLTQCKPIIVTTNLSVDTLRAVCDDPDQDVLRRRIYSRISELARDHCVQLTGRDHRF